MKPLVCPTCFAQEIDPILLRFDEQDNEYYCTKCTWFGTEAVAREALHQLMFNKHRVRIARSPTGSDSQAAEQ